VIVIQLGIELYTQKQPGPVFKVSDPLPPAAGIVAEVGLSDIPQELAFSLMLHVVTVDPLILTVILANRADDVEFDATVTEVVNEKLAVPEAGDSVTQEGLSEVTDQLHPVPLKLT
jgi:hypothetical protein